MTSTYELGSVATTGGLARRVVIPEEVLFFGSVGVGLFVGLQLGGPVGAAAGALVGAFVGTLAGLKVARIIVHVDRSGAVKAQVEFR